MLEGIDGAGKSTVAERLVEHLETTTDRPVVLTREPTGSVVGQALRQVLADPDHEPVSEALLFTADHAHHVTQLRERLAAGELVVSDRYSFSCLAYQGATLEPGWPERDQAGPQAWLKQVLAPFELAPSLVLLLDLAPEVAVARLGGRAGANEKFERLAFLERVRENYQALAKDHGFVTVDASGDLEATVTACIEALETHREAWAA